MFWYIVKIIQYELNGCNPYIYAVSLRQKKMDYEETFVNYSTS
jgi:hypothetical protein